MKLKTLRKIFRRSIWTMLTIFFSITLAIVIIGTDIANGYQAAINGVFKTTPYKQVELGEPNGPDTDYYKSAYMKKDAQGNPLYEKDENGVWHPVYDHEAMRANSYEVAYQTAVEGSVILWNNKVGNTTALPLAENSRVSLFGISSASYSHLAGGSGGMWVVSPNTIRSAFTDAKLSLNLDLYMNYANISSQYSANRLRSVNEAPWSAVAATVSTSVQNGDTGVMIMTRIGDEHTDIVPWIANDNFVEEKNYLDITEQEADVLSHLCQMKKDGKLARVVLLINSSNALQFKHLKEYDIDACVWVGMGGSMAYSQLASVLSGRGEYSVSGRLPDTFVYDNASTPVSANFGDFTWKEYSDRLPDLQDEGKYTFGSYNTKYIVYQEGIYVGYRYYETRYEDWVMGSGNAGGAKGAKMSASWDYTKEVAYPFGYGLSYTNFKYSNVNIKPVGDNYEITLTVTNDGETYSGKEVVQVYIQKPYTDYDKEHGIEKSAVELVGFAKTKNLAPHEPQDIKITVSAEEFKCYDSNGAGTYILEQGDYYLAIGTSSHDALNNILAKKGYTPENTEGRMDAAGNADYAELFHIAKDDFEKYSKSSATDEPIVNRFDEADLNRYDATTQTVKYLSRNDWNGTYPETAVVLNCTENDMIEDMQYGHPVEAKEGDKMPKYNEVTADEGKLNLIMLMDLDYEDEKWQDLLNQMTVEEQQFLISYGLLHLAGAETVAAPGAEANDGPAGIKTGNPVLGSTMSFPGECLLSSTYDVELIEKLGEAFGMEILHAGCSIIYGPGGCIHRSPYSGRNWEYFSEDGFLTGKMLAAEVTGIQKYGVIVLTKHFALNDEETNRYGVATFANEQSIREIYLKAFELAVTEGKMNGVMSSFNRIGTTWAGSHKGLLTDVLRGEWGFNGMIESDSCTGTTDYVHHMTTTYAKAEGLMAGSNVWMCGTGSESFVSEHTDNPTVMLALREACHRILYAQLHSNAMNGVSTTTKILRVKTWWQSALDGTIIGVAIIDGLCLLMMIAAYIIHTNWFKNKFRAIKATIAHNREVKALLAEQEANGGGADGSGGGGDGTNGDDGGDKPKYNPFKQPVEWWKSLTLRNKIISIVACSLAVVMIALAIILPCTLSNCNPAPTHECGHVCIECGKCLDDECDDPVCSDKCEGHIYVHECEEICPECGKCLNLTCEEEVCADKCGEGKAAHEFLAINAELTNGKNGAMRTETTNGKTVLGNVNQNTGAKITFNVESKGKQTVSLVVYVSLRYCDTVFTDIMYTKVNGVELTRQGIVYGSPDNKNNWTTFQGCNLGCIELEDGNNVIDFSVVSGDELSGYNFWKIEILSENEVQVPHICHTVCPDCGKCLDLSCNEGVCADKCENAKANCLIYEAEKSSLSNGGKGGAYDPHSVVGGSGIIVNNLNKNEGVSLEFPVYTEKATRQTIYMVVSKRPGAKVTDFFDITLNGEPYTTDATIKAEGATDTNTYVLVLLGDFDLIKGLNKIKFTVKTAADVGFNVDKIIFFGDDEITDEVPFDEESGVYEGQYAEFIAGAAGLPRKEGGTDPSITVIGNLSSNKGAGLKFKVNAKADKNVLLKVWVTQRSKDLPFSGAYTVTVNGVVIPFNAIVPAGAGGVDKWFDPVEVTLGEIELKAGENIITFVVPSSDGYSCFNFDKMVLEEVSCQHTYEENYTKDETHHWKAATCGHDVKGSYAPHDWNDEFVCTVCGYAKHFHTYNEDEWATDAGAHWHAATCEHEDEIKDYGLHTLVANVCTTCGYTASYAHSLKLEAEAAIPGEGSAGSPKMGENGGSDKVVGNINNNIGAKLGFTFSSATACEQDLFMTVCLNPNQKVSDYLKIEVNGVEVETDTVLPAGNGGGIEWSNYIEVYIGKITVQQGDNLVVFTVKEGSTEKGYNFDYITIKGETELSATLNAEDHSEGIYQAERAEFVSGSGGLPTVAMGTNCIYVGKLSGNAGAGLKFTVHSDTEKVVTLTASVTQRSTDLPFSGAYTVTINGEPIEVWATVPAGAGNTDKWFTSTEVELGAYQLTAGDNVIVFTVASSSGSSCFNFDYIKVEDGGTVHVHEYATEYTTDDDWHWYASTCGHPVVSGKGEHTVVDDVCSVCGMSQHVHTFAENFVADAEHHWKPATCSHSSEISEYGAHEVDEGSSVCKVCHKDLTPKTLRLEAEKATPAAGSNGGPNMTDNGGTAAGNMNNNYGASLTFKFNAAEAGVLDLVMRVCLRYDAKVSDFIKIEVNGVEFETDAVLPSGGSGINWSNYIEVALGTINVVEGENTIKFTVKSGSTEKGYNFDYIKLTGIIQTTDPAATT